jgi:hypothetical protein
MDGAMVGVGVGERKLCLAFSNALTNDIGIVFKSWV